LLENFEKKNVVDKFDKFDYNRLKLQKKLKFIFSNFQQGALRVLNLNINAEIIFPMSSWSPRISLNSRKFTFWKIFVVLFVEFFFLICLNFFNFFENFELFCNFWTLFFKFLWNFWIFWNFWTLFKIWNYHDLFFKILNCSENFDVLWKQNWTLLF